MNQKIKQSFYLGDDVVEIAKSLLGCSLYTYIGGKITGGIITETEAYNGIEDKASHSYGNRRTERTEIMYREGGIAYVYLCYGIHYLINVVTGPENIPQAVLLRGIFPTIGIQKILKRTGKQKVDYGLTNGPGKLTKSLGINIKHNGIRYDSDIIWIENNNLGIIENDISVGPRIGVDYAGDDARLPYRFVLNYKNYV